jgi:oligopeptide transport system ATP-binding protein
LALLELRGVTKTYHVGGRDIEAVRGVDLDVDAGETVALVGESGCGKSSLARMVAGLAKPTAGQVTFDGREVTTHLDLAARRSIQMVFQHPQQSLNARFRVASTLMEPAKLLGQERGKDLERRIDDTLKLVGLDSQYRRRRPRELSGGQQQRVAIARALICEPGLIVLDEPTSSLDRSIRGRILSLLRMIQDERGVSYLLISHDLSTVRQVAHRVAVMYLGRVVELADTQTLFDSPQHPYTRALLSAVPKMDPRATHERIRLLGETPSASDLPVGCSFQDRCPLVHDLCRRQSPALASYEAGHLVECFAVSAKHYPSAGPPNSEPMQNGLLREVDK